VPLEEEEEEEEASNSDRSNTDRCIFPHKTRKRRSFKKKEAKTRLTKTTNHSDISVYRLVCLTQ
jgi:hypothetical protein